MLGRHVALLIFGLTILLRYQERWNLHLKLLPILLGGVQKVTGTRPTDPGTSKGRWLLQDLNLNARFYNVPFRGLPAGFGVSVNSMKCQRILTAIAESKGYDSKELSAAFLAFYRAIFGVEPNTELNTNDSNFLSKCCVSAGFTEAEAEQYLRSSEDPTIKLRLKENTELAVEKGMFGAPAIFLSPVDKRIQGGSQPHERMWFGSDRFEQMAFAISKRWEGPNPPRSRL